MNEKLTFIGRNKKLLITADLCFGLESECDSLTAGDVDRYPALDRGILTANRVLCRAHVIVLSGPAQRHDIGREDLARADVGPREVRRRVTVRGTLESRVVDVVDALVVGDHLDVDVRNGN